MKWMEVRIHTTQEAVEAITNMLHELGASGVVIEDPTDLVKDWDTALGEVYELNPDDYPNEGVILKAYLTSTPALPKELEGLKRKMDRLVDYGIQAGNKKITMSEVDEEDWATAWKKYYKPVKISKKLTIVPTWEEYESSKGELVIELDPGMAFGTGTHPTTVMCLQALEKYLTGEDTVIDVGTGSGILSIGAAKLGAKQVWAYDLDEVAVTSAIGNIALNKADHVVTVGQNNLLENVEIKADLIVANLLAEIIVRFVDQAYNQIRDGGYFITSGIISKKKDLVSDALIGVGFSIVEIMDMEDWVAIIAQKNK